MRRLYTLAALLVGLAAAGALVGVRVHEWLNAAFGEPA